MGTCQDQEQIWVSAWVTSHSSIFELGKSNGMTMSNMYYWLQNDVRPPMAGRLTGTVGCAASHPGSAAQYIPLASCSPQTRWAGSETRRSGRPASQMSVAKMPAANHLQTCVDLSMMLVTITSPRNYLQ